MAMDSLLADTQMVKQAFDEWRWTVARPLICCCTKDGHMLGSDRQMSMKCEHTAIADQCRQRSHKRRKITLELKKNKNIHSPVWPPQIAAASSQCKVLRRPPGGSFCSPWTAEDTLVCNPKTLSWTGRVLRSFYRGTGAAGSHHTAGRSPCQSSAGPWPGWCPPCPRRTVCTNLLRSCSPLLESSPVSCRSGWPKSTHGGWRQRRRWGWIHPVSSEGVRRLPGCAWHDRC